MFEPVSGPRVFGLPLGADLGDAVTRGVIKLTADQGPDALSRVEIVVNTRRLQRRLRDCLDQGSARLHPKVRVLSDLALDPAVNLPLPIPPLRRKLDLMRLISGLIEAQPDLAPRAAAFDLATSLSALFEELHGEGLEPSCLSDIVVPDGSEHWQRTLRFVQLVADYFDTTDQQADAEGRLRRVAEQKAAEWAESPPDHPVLLVGSTGSRGATAVFMDAVARLPQGAVVLPGFDFDLPASVWRGMSDALTAEDHPQFRFRRLMDRLEIEPGDIKQWYFGDAPCAPRNRLVSLSLRPAPVTDQWQIEAPLLKNIEDATRDITLVEAQSRREEADVIALRLRQAVEDGQTAALVSPDRMMTRQVAAALDKWDIEPDDSAGMPLALSPPGRFLLHVLALRDRELTAEALLTLLKHPLCATGADDRNQHLLLTRELEMHLRSNGIPFPSSEALQHWASLKPEKRQAWSDWICDVLDRDIGGLSLNSVEGCLRDHISIAEFLAAGPGADGTGDLWAKAAGRTARATLDEALRQADAAGDLSAQDYAALFPRLLSTSEVRQRDTGHPQVLIWGTLEARVQSVDLVILGSMNDGTWPEVPAADPWLNRQMRMQVGLLLPERRIGLSAHDYQQAMAAKDVWITRAIRSDDAQTVPSRWVNRLTNLLSGINDGAELSAMRQRGEAWLGATRKRAKVTPVPREGRPSPCPPVEARPKRLSVTQIERLIRDPFAIYARKVLRLDRLHPLQREADALLRGIIAHSIVEEFLKTDTDPAEDGALAAFLEIAEEGLLRSCPWPTARQMWLGRLTSIAPWFLDGEVGRRGLAKPSFFEIDGRLDVPGTGVTLTARADRVDMATDGTAHLYDYKTGKPPAAPQQAKFNPQLLLQAAMAEQGGFAELGRTGVAGAAYIGLGAKPEVTGAPLDKEPPEKVWKDLILLLQKWQDPARGYSSRLANFSDMTRGDYDHLARFDEWDMSAAVEPVILT